MRANICEILGINYPIFQGAMAWIADGELAAAVSNAGGLGIIAGGNAPADVVRKEIKRAKELTDKPFGVNIMLLSPFVDEVVDVVCEEKIRVVTTGAGNPAKYVEKFQKNDIIFIPVVPSVAIAKKMEKLGAEAIIPEGMEAGGHIGKLTTMSLLPQVVDAVNIPVIAAGGIGDGRGVAACFILGASGAQLGTRFLVAKECNVHQNYKNLIISSKDIDSTTTGEITGHPVRCIRNKLTRQFDLLEKEERRKEEPDISKIEELGSGALRKAVVDGDVQFGSVMAGQIAGMIKKEQTCKEIIDEIISEAKELMGQKFI